MTAGCLVHHPIAQTAQPPALEVAGIVRSSVVDGPGHRYVLFLQGCNFNCVACHNPTTIGRCDACGVCVDACPHGALELPTEGHVTFDLSACDGCRDCVAVCPIDADATIRVVPARDLVGEIEQVAPFISGVTITGGEPTLQLEGLIALCGLIKSSLPHLTVLLDTNGTLDTDGWSQLAPVIDGAMVDLKAGTPELHRQVAGGDIVPVKDSIEWLAAHDLLEEVRLLVIEGVTDRDDELEAWAEYVRSVDPSIAIRVMAFRHAGTRRAAWEWPETSPEAVDRVVDTLQDLGLTNVRG